MRLFNSATQEVEQFRPRTGQPVTVYVCGITPYDTTHLGHAFTYVMFDVLIRHMRTVHGWSVRYVQNVTDIDDDILKRAKETGSDWRKLGQEWTARFTQDMALLNILPPDVFPGATGYIRAMQRHIRALIGGGLAYARGGSVYFRIRADRKFGCMARMERDAMLATANERGNVPDDPNKDDPLDFVLWQAGKPGEPAWDSPWGAGRPGWHIECSTMALELLGEQLDIHGGGADLLFPHHACSVAQAEPVSGRCPWVRFWVHTAMVRKDGEKISKSLGNLVLAHELLQRHHPDTLRLYLLRSHYRSPWEWDTDTFEATAAWTRSLHAAVGREAGQGGMVDPASYGPRFTAAMDDDLDAPSALGVVMDLADDILAAPADANVTAVQDVLRTLAGNVLGLWLQPMDGVPGELRERSQWPDPEIAPPDGIFPL